MFVFFTWNKFDLSIFGSFHLKLLIYGEILLYSRRKDTFLHHFSQVFLHFLLSSIKFGIFFRKIFLPVFEMSFELLFIVKPALVYVQNGLPNFRLYLFFMALLDFFIQTELFESLLKLLLLGYFGFFLFLFFLLALLIVFIILALWHFLFCLLVFLLRFRIIVVKAFEWKGTFLLNKVVLFG